MKEWWDEQHEVDQMKVDPSAAELSRRRRHRKIVTRRISAENWIRPGDRRRRKKLRRLAEFLGDSNWIIVHQTVVYYGSALDTNNCKLLLNSQLTLELLRIWEIISQ